jgi:integrase
MRFNEICEAKPDWFNLEGDGHIYIHNQETVYPDGRVVKFVTKNKKNRYVPLSPRFKEFLKTYGLRAPFMLEPTVTHGKGYRYDFRKLWYKVMDAAAVKINAERVKQGKEPTANFKWLHPHIARHTFASLLAQSGISIYKIAQWIGDGVKVCTDHYAHLAPSDNAINAID